jgi:hypothetical protein
VSRKFGVGEFQKSEIQVISSTKLQVSYERRRRPKKRPVKKEFFLSYLLKIAEQSDIHHSSIDIHHSSFDKVSYERRRWPQASSQIK